MNVPLTLGSFALGLAVVFGGATALGSAIGPVGPATHGAGHGATTSSGHGAGHGDTVTKTPASETLPGLAITQEGYTLQLDAPSLSAGTPGALSFAITDSDGMALTDYTPTHDRDLHLIVVQRDLTAFQHVHPTRDANGHWSVPITLKLPGAYKVFADFAPKGRDTALVLGTDLIVPGATTDIPLPPVSRTAEVDGLTVTLQGDLRAGKDSPVVLTVSKQGRPITDLQPYLAAYGHLVALRVGDLAYLHVHPEDGKPAPGITFTVDVPTAGTYRLFLDFKYGDAVHTASFTINAERP